MEVILLRHGDARHNGPDQTTAKQDGDVPGPERVVFAGQGMDTDLRETGIRDTDKFANKIIEMGGCDVIYCSWMKRSKQTAELVSRAIQNKTGKIVPVIELPGIEEVDGGDFTGKTAEEIKAVFPEAAKHFYENDIANIHYPGGESYAQIAKRTKTALQEVMNSLEHNKRPAIVTHANTIKVMRHWLAEEVKADAEDHIIDVKTFEEDHTNRGIWRYTISVFKFKDLDSK